MTICLHGRACRNVLHLYYNYVMCNNALIELAEFLKNAATARLTYPFLYVQYILQYCMTAAPVTALYICLPVAAELQYRFLSFCAVLLLAKTGKT
jgi:hypothetical protein